MDPEPIKNLLLITVDCLRSTPLAGYAAENLFPPGMQALADRGVRFDNALSLGGGTPEAFPSILKSCSPPPIHPQQDPDAYRRFVSEGPSLPEIMHRAGFNTAAFHSNPWLSRWYGYGKGFEHFNDSFSPGEANPVSSMGHIVNRIKPAIPQSWLFLSAYDVWQAMADPPYTRAEVETELAFKYASQNRNMRQFIWIHYMDCHQPYSFRLWTTSQNERTRLLDYARIITKLRRNLALSPEGRASLALYYLLALRRVAAQIDLLLSRFEKLGLLEETLVVLTGDHGEAFGEHEAYGHGFVDHEVLTVPLVFSHKTLDQGLVSHEPVSNADILPTVLDLLHIDSKVELVGTSLTSLLRKRSTHLSQDRTFFSVAYTPPRREARYAIQRGGWKVKRLITFPKPGSSGLVAYDELFNVIEDKSETKNVKDEEPEIYRGLEEDLEKHLRPTDKSWGAERTSGEDMAAVEERLRRLGYL